MNIVRFNASSNNQLKNNLIIIVLYCVNLITFK